MLCPRRHDSESGPPARSESAPIYAKAAQLPFITRQIHPNAIAEGISFCIPAPPLPGPGGPPPQALQVPNIARGGGDSVS